MTDLATINNLLSQFRREYGCQATYNGHTYAITTSVVPAVRAGVYLHGDLDPLAASCDPRVFSFNYADFGTNSDTPPAFNSHVTYHGNSYTITRVEQEQVNAADTLAYRVFAYRTLNSDMTSVFLTQTYNYYIPNSQASQTNGTTKNVLDISYTSQTPIKAMLNPISSTEKALYFGKSDIRGCNAYTLTDLPVGAYLVNQSTGEAWEVATPSQSYPATGLLIAVVRHRDVPPSGVS